MREKRFSRVLEILERSSLDACLIRGMDNIYYLTGFRGSEGSLLVTRGDVLLMTDFRYITHARETVKGCTVIEKRPRDDTLVQACARYGIRRLGFDSFHTVYHAYEELKEMVPGVELAPVGAEIEEIRKCKDQEEIEIMRRAVAVATEAFNSTLARMAPGRTEREIANDLDYAMRRLGAEEPAFETIVASGPRAALPHARPSDKALKNGEAVIIDFGCRLDGYASDETCTVLVGETDGRLREIYQIVNEARKKGIASARAGLPIRDLDGAVRGYIEETGYGKFFGHGTGHGVGVAVHEAPAISGRIDGILEEDMVITVEPGIYLPDVGGVRLEDMVLIGSQGAVVLTQLRKDMIQI